MYNFNYKTLTEVFNNIGQNNTKGITFIQNGHDEYLSYMEIYQNSLKVLNELQKRGLRPDDKVIFQLKDPKEFILTFWACILGGFTPVPLEQKNIAEYQLKMFKIWKNFKHQYLITSKEISDKLEIFASNNDLEAQMEEIKSKTIIYSDIDFAHNEDGEIYNALPDKTAFIQFSSGTTGDPKGVVVTHHNLITNINAMTNGAKVDQNDSFLSWMPLSHDMGLIAYHLWPTKLGVNHYIIPTSIFLLRPMIWMGKASKYKATILSSPNFGYKHFLNFYNVKSNKDWDLSNVKLVLNGAEPISYDLCERFLDELEHYGLKRNAMYPCYGLAEATLAVSFPPPEEEAIPVTVDRSKLEIGKPVIYLSKNASNAITFLDVGFALKNSPIRIVDSNKNILPENHIGHLEINGENVTQGYYANKIATDKVLSKDGWLDTGDLGFIRNNRLIITGRAKDIIFAGGQNYYSHDIEIVAEKVEGIELGNIAATGAFNPILQEDELILFVRDRLKHLDKFAQLAIKLKEYINCHIGIKVNHVIPIKQIPKTTSGKVQRGKLRNNYLNGDYNELVSDISERIENRLDNTAKEYKEETTGALLKKTQAEIIKLVSKVLCININTIEADVDLDSYGLSSLNKMQLANYLKDRYGDYISPELVFDSKNIRVLSEKIVNGANNNTELSTSIDEKANIEKSEISYKQPNCIYSYFETKKVFITGATGVLGGNLIKEFLESTDCELFCLVRGSNLIQAKERIRTFLKVYDPEEKLKSEFEKRVHPYIGDITDVKLGLDNKTYGYLANNIDMVIHGAAITSLHGVYDSVKQVNVDGTQHLIDFTLQTKQKYFIFISSYSVMGDRENKQCAPFSEKDFDLRQGFENKGYQKSKFEAEKMIRTTDNGLNWIIIRPGNIFGDSENGYYPFNITGVEGVFYDIFKTDIEKQFGMNNPMFFDITPVDFVSKGIIHLSTSYKKIYETFHLVNPDKKRFFDVLYLLREYGYDIELLSYKDYMHRIQRRQFTKDKKEYNSLTTDLIRFNPKIVECTFCSYADSEYTKKILEKADIKCPEIDIDLINTYLDHCVSIGYIPHPEQETNQRSKNNHLHNLRIG